VDIARGDASEEQLFDELSRGLAAGAISRGRALKLAGAAILGSAGLLTLFPGVAGARSDPQCRGEPSFNNRNCRGASTCRGRINQNCACAKTVSGDKRCVQLRNQLPCPGRDQCDGRGDCRRGAVCIQVGGCCGHPRRNLCIDLCV
jgi:hypothetical protein